MTRREAQEFVSRTVEDEGEQMRENKSINAAKEQNAKKNKRWVKVDLRSAV